MLEEEELRGSALLVFANKQDLPGAVSASDLTERLALPEQRSRKWYVQASCAPEGTGLFEGLDWLANQLQS